MIPLYPGSPSGHSTVPRASPVPPIPAAGKMKLRSRGLRPNLSNRSFSKALKALVPITPRCAAVSAKDVPGLMFIKTLGMSACEHSLEAAAMTLVMDRQLGTYVGNDASHVYVSFEPWVAARSKMGGSGVSPPELSFSLETCKLLSTNN